MPKIFRVDILAAASALAGPETRAKQCKSVWVPSFVLEWWKNGAAAVGVDLLIHDTQYTDAEYARYQDGDTVPTGTLSSGGPG